MHAGILGVVKGFLDGDETSRKALADAFEEAGDTQTADQLRNGKQYFFVAVDEEEFDQGDAMPAPTVIRFSSQIEADQYVDGYEESDLLVFIATTEEDLERQWNERQPGELDMETEEDEHDDL